MVHPTRPLEVLREWSDGRDIGYVGMEVYIIIYIREKTLTHFAHYIIYSQSMEVEGGRGLCNPLLY